MDARASSSVQGGAEVRRLAVEPGEPRCSLGQRERPAGMPARDQLLLACAGEPLVCVHPDRLEQAVAPFPASFLDADQRLLGEAREDVSDPGHVEAIKGADLLDRLELEAAERRPQAGGTATPRRAQEDRGSTGAWLSASAAV